MELKPCPKCYANNKRTFSAKCYFETQYKVKCLKCGFETDLFETKEEAQETWNSLVRNKRVALEDVIDLDAQTKANNDAMRKVIDFIAEV